jgi:ATP dependent DNA ligase domain
MATNTLTVIVRENRSKSEPGKKPYITKLDTATGTAWCDCRGWIYNKGAVKSCTHTRELVADYQAGRVTLATPDLYRGPVATTRVTTPPVAKPVDPTAIPVRPMLAQAMTKGQRLSAYMTDRYVLQVKKDGHRKMVRKAGDRIDCWSRPAAGKDALRYALEPMFVEAFRTMPDGVYDGELMIPTTTSFRATYPHFVLFDVVELLGQSVVKKPHHERRQHLAVALAHYTKQLDDDEMPVLELVEELPVTQANIDALFAADEEGGIIRRVDSSYQPGYRSPDWIKVKRVGHETVTITGFERGKAASSTPWSVTLFRRQNGMVGKCSTKDNATVEAVRRNPDAFIGRRLVIEYVELEPSGAFRSGGWDHLAGVGE